METSWRKVAGYFITFVTLGTLIYGLTSFMRVAPSTVGEASYTNTTYGISFMYPDSYRIEEREVGNGERGHFSLALIDKGIDVPEAGEGPTAITIDVYQNNLDKLSVEKWIRNTADSNFKLSTDEKLIGITVGGVPGFYYHWDGLYQGESTVIAHKDNIVVFSATSLSPSDQIRNDYGKILGSVVLN